MSVRTERTPSRHRRGLAAMPRARPAGRHQPGGLVLTDGTRVAAERALRGTALASALRRMRSGLRRLPCLVDCLLYLADITAVGAKVAALERLLGLAVETLRLAQEFQHRRAGLPAGRGRRALLAGGWLARHPGKHLGQRAPQRRRISDPAAVVHRSEEHTSELQS